MRQGLRSEPGTSTHYNIIIIRIITILLLQQGFIHEVLNTQCLAPAYEWNFYAYIRMDAIG